jgi:hypothetical protein
MMLSNWVFPNPPGTRNNTGEVLKKQRSQLLVGFSFDHDKRGCKSQNFEVPAQFRRVPYLAISRFQPEGFDVFDLRFDFVEVTHLVICSFLWFWF